MAESNILVEVMEKHSSGGNGESNALVEWALVEVMDIHM